MKKEFVKKALQRIKDQQPKYSALKALGVDVMELQDQLINIIEESISVLLSNNDDKKHDLILQDIQWWLYENVDKIISYDENKVDVNSLDNYVNWMFEHYEVLD